MITKASALVAVGLALTVAACGSSGSSGPTESSLKTAFAANKVVLTALGNDVSAGVTHARGQTDLALASQFSALSTRATAEVAALKALKAPTKFNAPLTALEDAVSKAGDDLHSIAAAANAHDATSAKTATESLILDSRVAKSTDNALSAQLGLPTAP
jgi:hypothetical protein